MQTNGKPDNEMEFETRFNFHDIKEFPPPLFLASFVSSSIKRKKSFSEKIFKGAAGSTLRLKKFMNRDKTTIKELFQKNDFSSFSDETSHTNSKGNEHHQPFSFPSLYSAASPESDYAPTLSKSVDSYIPLPSNSSVITVNSFKSFKSPSQHKLGTFKRTEPYSSPHRNLFKKRFNKNKPIIIDEPQKDDIDSLYSSPMSYRLPLTPFLNSTFSSSSSLNLNSPDGSITNYYGQVNDKKKLARTDYSFRVSNVLNNCKQSKQIESPRVRTSSSFSDSFSSDSSILDGDKSPTFSINSNASNYEFQKELLSKCSKLRKSEDGFTENSILINLERGTKSQEIPKINFMNLDPFSESKLFQTQGLKLKATPSSISPGKPKISPKPEIAPKPGNHNNKLGKPYNSKTVPNLDLSQIQTLTKKPNEHQNKPNIPTKPQSLKNAGSPTFKFVPELNNNYIVVNKDKDLYSTTIQIFEPETKSSQHLSKNESSISCRTENNGQMFSSGYSDKLNRKSSNLCLSKLKIDENNHTLKVKDLAAAFDKVLISPKETNFNNYDKFNLKKNMNMKSNKSFSDHDLTHPHKNQSFGKYGSISDKLNEKYFLNRNICN